MRAIIYIISLSFLFTSCRSIDKMVEVGNFDQAFAFAINKLSGKKAKKTKYVKGIEQAYNMLNEEDMARIASLSKRSNGLKWTEMFYAYERIEVRQNLIIPLLPIVSKDGYKAKIFVNDYIAETEFARENAIQYHTDIGEELMDKSYAGNKGYARMAYNEFEKAQSLGFGDSAIESKMREAHERGIVHVGIDMDYNEYAFNSVAFRNGLRNINTSKLNSFWTRFYVIEANMNSNEAFDRYVVLDYNAIDFGREKETVNIFDQHSRVENGFRNVLDDKGKTKLDSLGNPITKTVYKKVKAKVFVTYREKFTQLNGRLMVFTDPSKSPVESIPINVAFDFIDEGFRIKGDKRAVSEDFRERRPHRVLDFPSDIECSNVLVEGFTKEVVREIKNIDFLNHYWFGSV